MTNDWPPDDWDEFVDRMARNATRVIELAAERNAALKRIAELEKAMGTILHRAETGNTDQFSPYGLLHFIKQDARVALGLPPAEPT